MIFINTDIAKDIRDEFKLYNYKGHPLDERSHYLDAARYTVHTHFNKIYYGLDYGPIQP